MELQPNRNISESVLHDRRSINLLKSILPDNCVDCSQLQEGGTLPNIDGYLEILDENGIAREKITVQVKHLTYPEKNGKVFYDIPESVYAYAKIHKVGSINSIFYFLHKTAEPFNCLEQDNLA